MARVTLTYQCGHQTTRQMPGHQAAYRQQRAATESCIDCIHQAENVQATLDAKTAGLPPLVGTSERQRAYGETCRAFVLERMVEILEADQPLNDGTEPLVEAGESDTFRGLLRYMRSRTDAAFWCDCQNINDRIDLIDFVMAEMGLGQRTLTGFIPVPNHLAKAAAWQPEPRHPTSATDDRNTP